MAWWYKKSILQLLCNFVEVIQVILAIKVLWVVQVFPVLGSVVFLVLSTRYIPGPQNGGVTYSVYKQ